MSKKPRRNEPPGRGYQKLVADVVKTFDAGADVKVGEWIDGPDGRLDMDVSVRGMIQGRPVLVVIECKDFDVASTGKVGRPIVDALDSKRHDLKADVAIICSNSGFTADALNKARRKNIGAVSILAAGDERVKIVIEREIYFRKISLAAPLRPFNVTCHGLDNARFVGAGAAELIYKGLPVMAWLQQRAAIFALAHPEISTQVRLTFGLMQPHDVEIKGQHAPVTAIEISFTPETRWFSQVVRLDAKVGLYDYLRGNLRLAGNENRYDIHGVDFDKGTPLDSAPAADERWPDTIEVFMANVEVPLSFPQAQAIAPLEEIVVREDVKIE